jgi:hypothetical protein
MRLDFDAQPIGTTTRRCARASRAFPIGPLLAAVAHATGDYTLLAEDLRPDPSRIVMMTDDGYVPPSSWRAPGRSWPMP